MLAGTFAVFLQIQITLLDTDTYAGLRMNLADLFLPVTGLVILASLLRKKSLWPQWKAPFGNLWPVVLTIALTFALVNYRFINGDISQWALVNKYIGWFVLMAYLYAGGWLGTNFSTQNLKAFVFPFACCFLIISGLSAISIVMAGYNLLPLPLARLIIPDYYQLEGMMGNRNALAFLFCVMMVFVTFFSSRHPDIVPRWFLVAFWAFFPALLCLNGSRALWGTTLVLFTYLGLTHKKIFLRHIFLPAFLGIIFFVLILHESQRKLIFVPFESSSKLVNHTLRPAEELSPLKNNQPKIHGGDNIRMKILGSSFERWKQSPVLGAGLGGGVKYQEVKYGEKIDIIDNSLMWILTDMGLAGVAAFLACFTAMTRSLWPYYTNKKREISDERQTLMTCAFLMLLIFGLFSLVHEIIYARFFWFILGLALAAPLPPPSADRMKSPAP